jgi:2-polyprenyl-3-methyl-5-hydroxy-6-metoxy-1,4-benzoquinol methylase
MKELSSLASHWNSLARDAKWAVLSDPSAKGGQWNDEAFWRTGEGDVRAVLADCARLEANPLRARALDFGCGVGRLSRALAAEFSRVDGVDVSSSMIELARQAAPANATFHENRVADLSIVPSASFDFVLTLIVLQHMRPHLMVGYLREFGRVLRPGGVIYFQVPSSPRPRFSKVRAKTLVRRVAFRVPGVKSLWRRVRGELPIEMYALPERQVRATLDALGFELLSVVEDAAAGEDWKSLRYVAKKR